MDKNGTVITFVPYKWRGGSCWLRILLIVPELSFLFVPISAFKDAKWKH